jgi:hypothetical protein
MPIARRAPVGQSPRYHGAIATRSNPWTSRLLVAPHSHPHDSTASDDAAPIQRLLVTTLAVVHPPWIPAITSTGRHRLIQMANMYRTLPHSSQTDTSTQAMARSTVRCRRRCLKAIHSPSRRRAIHISLPLDRRTNSTRRRCPNRIRNSSSSNSNHNPELSHRS